MGNANGEKPSKPKKKSVKKVAVAQPVVGKQVSENVSTEFNNSDETKEPRVLTKDLSEKHIYFAKRLCLTGFNASKAAREAGFTPWYGVNILAHDPRIKAIAEKMRVERARKFEVTSDRIIAELATCAFSNMGTYLRIAKDGTPIIDCEDVGVEELAALAQIEQEIYTERTGGKDMDSEDTEPVKKTKIKLHNKLDALNQLSKIFVGGLNENDSPEKKAAKIQAALKAMREVDQAG
jgi:hypothetical protein